MNRKQFKLILELSAVVLALILFFVGISKLEDIVEYHSMADYDEDDEDDEITLNEGELLINGKVCRYDAAVRNYLIIGTDISGTYGEENPSEYRGNMADVLLLVVLNRSDNNYAVLEIDRNTVMKVPMMNSDGTVNARSMMQICTAHWYGGDPKMSSENTVNAVSELLGGLPIDGYYELNMDSIEQLNHAIGGVTVTVEGDFSEVDPTLIEGQEITLNDKQAYNYIHARMEVGDGTNEARMARQEAYIKSFLNKLMERSEEDKTFPNEIYKEMKEVAVTDMSGNDFSRVLNRVSRGENLGTISFEGEHVIGQLINDDVDHQEFYIDDDSYYKVMDKLFQLSPLNE
ncbi:MULTISPECIES: LCP family protein [unclassified Butyrivibrio]|uniref:LCP family protein n=1 Tax=unclassified Butyrivibrio TaxID=2639466 RepID=UPI00047A39CA|nr:MULTISPECIES: LCP family protein [unclassified Butyrivibrio]